MEHATGRMRANGSSPKRTGARSHGDCRSLYLTMRDGVRIAVDVWLPGCAPTRVGSVLHQTRYHRRVEWSGLAERLGLHRTLHVDPSTRERHLAAGLAWIDVDVRGSGASFGSRPVPWYEAEVLDAVEIVDWIVKQPWSNGRVGTTGVSYGGTAAEHLVAQGHPAVRAAALRFSLFDVYRDVAFPGGVHLSWFTEAWGTFNRYLDDNRFSDAIAHAMVINARAFADYLSEGVARDPWEELDGIRAPWFQHGVSLSLARLVRGVAPVDDPSRIAQAILDHRDNANVHDGAVRMRYRDDRGVSPTLPDATIDSFSPHVRIEQTRGSGTPILNVSGWLDGAYQRAAIQRHRALDSTQSTLLLGPWDHGGLQDISPFSPPRIAAYDHDGELVRFFLPHLSDGDTYDRAPVRYYTLGEERWKDAPTFPPPGTEGMTLFLGQERKLSPEPEPTAGSATYDHDPELGTGFRSRWRSLLRIAAPVGYGHRAARSKRMLTFESKPLNAPWTITGSPLVHLVVAIPAEDATLFAYIDAVEASGRSLYITEGQQRLRFRPKAAADGSPSTDLEGDFCAKDEQPVVPGEPCRVSFELLPVSFRIEAGMRVRLALSLGDAHHFARRTDDSVRVDVLWGPNASSRLSLPLEPR